MMFLLHLFCWAAGVLLVLATLPLVLELVVLTPAATLPCPKPMFASGQAFRLAVVVPAHNEQALIAACGRSLLASGGAATRVYVVAHNCSDGTASEAVAAGARVLVLNQGAGKGTALDFGFAQALREGAEGVLVVDADSVVSGNLLPTIAARLAAGAQALQCRYEVANAAATTRTRLMALAFAGMNVLRPRGRDRLGLSCGIFGNGFALAAGTLQAVPYTANSLVEDLEYHLHLLRAGVRVEFVDEAAVFGEMPVASAASATQRARWEGGRLRMRRQWAGPLAVEVGRGRMRMLEPLLDLLALPLATEAGLLLAALLLGVVGAVPWLWIYAIFGLMVLAAYVVTAALLGPEPRAALKALLAAPAYMLWKLLLLPKTMMAGRNDASWVRTRRNAETPAEPSGKTSDERS